MESDDSSTFHSEMSNRTHERAFVHWDVRFIVLLKNKSLIPCISCSKILICTLNVFSKSANTAVLTTDFTTSSLWKRQNCFCVYEVNLENNIRRPFMGFSFQTQSSNMFVCAVSGYLRK